MWVVIVLIPDHCLSFTLFFNFDEMNYSNDFIRDLHIFS